MFDVNFTELFEILKTGKLFELASSMWNSALGPFYIVGIYAILVLPAYFKTKSIVPPAILTVLFTSILIPLMPPQVHVFLYMMILFAVAAILFRLFVR